MSAFIVSRFHIHQLVTALDRHLTPSADRDTLGQALWNANIASVQHCYHNEPVVSLPGPCNEDYVYAYVAPRKHLTPIAQCSMLRCYVSQSWERPDWEDSEIAALCNRLEAALLVAAGKKDMAAMRATKEYQDTSGSIYDDEPEAIVPEPVQQEVRHIDLITTAKMVRAALKTAFPGVTFSVRTERYSGGSSIRVAWMDGPTMAQADIILKQYEGATFDSMIDLKSARTTVHDGVPTTFGADFVSGNRDYSKAFMEPIAARVAALYHVEPPAICVMASGHAYPETHGSPSVEAWGPGTRRDGTRPLHEVIYQACCQTSAMAKPRIRVYPIVNECVAS